MPDPVIRMIAILPEKMKGNAYAKELRDAVREEMREHKRLWLLVSNTWKEKDKPTWNITTRFNRESIVGTCKTNSTPMVYLELGTKRRKRRMQKGYQKRTRPGYLGSFAGAKEADGWYDQPVPGIKAGNWRNEVVKQRKAKFPVLVAKAMFIGSLTLFPTGKGIETR